MAYREVTMLELREGALDQLGLDVKRRCAVYVRAARRAG